LWPIRAKYIRGVEVVPKVSHVSEVDEFILNTYRHRGMATPKRLNHFSVSA